MPPQSIAQAVGWLDSRISDDPSLNSDTFARLTAAQRELGLLHGARPTCPFLRPYILSRSQYEEIARAAETLAGAFERLVAAALDDDALMSELALTEREERMARIDPGYRVLCVNSRLDAFLSETGFQFLEYNAENPAGISDQMQLEKILFGLPHMKEFLERYPHWSPRAHIRLLDTLLDVYRQWGGEQDHPQIAIVDWEGVSTASEFVVLKEYFESQGYPTTIADPRALEYDGDELSADGFRIDIFYKRIIIHEFLEKFDETHPLVRAYASRRVCMANSFRTKVAHKKAGFTILSDPRHEHLFTPEQVSCIRQHVPWSRRVREGRTTFEGVEYDLVDLLRRERERLVMKPNDDYGGEGVVIGWETDPESWEQAIKVALGRPYVVQERAPVQKVSIPMFTDQVEIPEMLVDFDPFLFLNRAEGGLVRLSSSSLSNISSGGGQTALLVLEDA
jgi:glutathionylspermidine synthase